MVIARGCGGVEWVKVQEGIGGKLNGNEKKKRVPRNNSFFQINGTMSDLS